MSVYRHLIWLFFDEVFENKKILFIKSIIKIFRLLHSLEDIDIVHWMDNAINFQEVGKK